MIRLVRSLLSRSRGRAGDDVDFKALADNSLDLIIRCGKDQIATYASPACTAILGMTPAAMVGRSHLEFVHPDDRAMLDEVLARHGAGEQDVRCTFRMIRTDEAIVWVQGSGRMVVDRTTGMADFIVTMRDVTDSKRIEEKLAALALTDGLTGLANRRAFDEALDREWRRCRRGDTSLSLLLLDVDHFKRFNDHYGHQAGDDCLRALASAIAGRIRRPGDLAARYGGEEIAVILPDTGSEGAMEVAEGVRAAVAALAIPHVQSTVPSRSVTVSIGAATAMPLAGVPVKLPEDLIQAADEALYKAKHDGRDRVHAALITTSGPREDAA